jgi:Grx4 family monothiol glutaredoxin
VEKFDINAVPTLAVIHPHKVQPELIENPSPERLAQTAEVQNEFYQKWFDEEKKKAFREIEDLVTSHPHFFMFIKGSPEQPKCKFTRKLLETLAPFNYRFRTFDILKDERIRQWLKFYSNWPTFPQIFVGGKFVGGVDIVCELLEGGEFDSIVPATARKPAPQEEVKELLA